MGVTNRKQWGVGAYGAALGGVAKAKERERGYATARRSVLNRTVRGGGGICQFAELPGGSRDVTGPRESNRLRDVGKWRNNSLMLVGIYQNLPLNWGVCHNVASATLDDGEKMRGLDSGQPKIRLEWLKTK